MPKRRSSPLDVEVGRRIRVRRMDLGISQTALGDALGVTFQQVQKYEKGANRVSAGRLKQIAQKLDVPMAYFYDETPAKSPPGQAAFEFLDNAYTLRLVRSFSRIGNRHLRRQIVHMVETIAETTRKVGPTRP